jgi:hypothetical protein
MKEGIEREAKKGDEPPNLSSCICPCRYAVDQCVCVCVRVMCHVATFDGLAQHRLG